MKKSDRTKLGRKQAGDDEKGTCQDEDGAEAEGGGSAKKGRMNARRRESRNESRL